jgi:hypothetical protein
MSAAVLSAGLGRLANVRVGLLFPGTQDSHGLPVIGKLFAAIQTDNISARLRSRLGLALSPSAGDGEAHAFMPASEQSIKDCHLLLQTLGSKRSCPEAAARYNDDRPVRYPALSRQAPFRSICLTSLVAANPDSFHLTLHGCDKKRQSLIGNRAVSIP